MTGSPPTLTIDLLWVERVENEKCVWFNPQFGLTVEGGSKDLEEGTRRFGTLLSRYKEKYGISVFKDMLDERRISYRVNYPTDAISLTDTKGVAKDKARELRELQVA